MVRREGRPRRAAQARKQGPDRKSLVKYVEREFPSYHPPPWKRRTTEHVKGDSEQEHV